MIYWNGVLSLLPVLSAMWKAYLGGEKDAFITRHVVRESRSIHRRATKFQNTNVMVAEDNAVSAADGKEALELYRETGLTLS